MTDQPERDRPVGAVVPSREDSKDWLAPPAAEPPAPPPPTPVYMFELFLFNEKCTIADGHAGFGVTPPAGYSMRNWELDAHANVVICWRRDG